MELLKSKRGIPLPSLFFISDREEIKNIPIGAPYFFASEELKENVIRLLEYEVLFEKAKSSGLPFNFHEKLIEAGFNDEIEINSKVSLALPDSAENKLNVNREHLSVYVSKSNYYVDIGLIKSLNIFPKWLPVLEEAISANIHNYATFDTNMWNKKLEGMYGGLVLKAPNRNLICIDISGSIPTQVAMVCLTLAQNMAESFYADILITGGTSVLFEYEFIQDMDMNKIYREVGRNNDQVGFKKLLTSSEREYNSLIVFGDEDAPGSPWSGSGMTSQEYEMLGQVSDEEGKKLNKWKVKKIISFHAGVKGQITNEEGEREYTGEYESGNERLAGYGRWFQADEIVKIKDWVVDLKD